MSSPTSELIKFELNNKIFKAGAGAGKTTRLVKEVYEFFHYYKNKYNKVPRIALTTFTRKATQELKERLMLFATLNKDDEFLEFVLAKNKLHISTIHGFLQMFLRQYAQLIDLDPGFSFLNEGEVFKNAKKILKKIITANSDYIQILEEVVYKDLVKLSIRHSNYKLIYKNYNQVSLHDLEEIKKDVYLTFKAKYIEVADKILAETNDLKWQEYAGNLKRVASALNNTLPFDEIVEISRSFRKPPHSKKKSVISDYTNDLCDGLKKEFTKLDAELFDDELIKSDIEMSEIFARMHEEFHQEFFKWKRESGKISMSDLESLSLSIAENFPHETGGFKNSFDYWLIDEYQDTSSVQVRLLGIMIGDRFKFVVGDPQQSIYYFRGARSEVFEDEVNFIKAKKGIYEELNTNYRSMPRLMNFLNYFFKNYQSEYSKQRFKEMKIGTEANDDLDISCSISLTQSEEEQALAISEKVLNLLNNGVVPSQIAIIARKNNSLKNISDAFLKAKIPFLLHTAQGFQDRREILDALSILKFLCVPYDNINLVSLLRSPWFRVKDIDLIQIVQNEKENYWAKLLERAEIDSEKYSAIMDLKSYLELSKDIGISAVFEKILSDKGFFDLSKHYDSSGRRESNLWKILTQLKSQDHKVGFNYVQFIEGHERLLDLDNLDQDSDAVSSLEVDRVNLMTVHMSKGLEFDHVFLPYIDKEPQLTKTSQYILSESEGKWLLNLKGDKEGSNKNLFSQGVIRKVKAQELAESDRLFYVALTRAKSSVHLYACGSKKANNSWLKNVKLDLSEGIHKHDLFSYQVLTKDFKEVSAGIINNIKLNLRPKYQIFEKKIVSESSTVTHLAKKNQISQVDLISLLNAAQTGTKLHRLFEAMKYNNEEAYLDLILENQSLEEKNKIEEILEYVKNLTDIPFKDILKKGYAEWGYLLQEGDTKIAGQIDLWGLVNNEAWIIDYKTGSSRYKDAAFEQLRAYAKAVAKFSKIKKINLVALYPTEKKYFKEEVSISN